jgi:hypothetical protein
VLHEKLAADFLGRGAGPGACPAVTTPLPAFAR